MKTYVTGTLMCLAIGLGSAAAAQDIGEPDAVIKYRKDAMASVGGQIRAMVANLKGEITDEAGLVAHANALAASTSRIILVSSSVGGAFAASTALSSFSPHFRFFFFWSTLVREAKA